MAIEFHFSDLNISGFRGIRELNLQLPEKLPTFIVGPNNSGKSTVLAALALALRGGGFHKFIPQPHDFFHDSDGTESGEFIIELTFKESEKSSLPAVQGVGNPVYVHGVRVIGRKTKNGDPEHRHILFDKTGNAITISPRTALKGQSKKEFKDHKLGWSQHYARLDDIRSHLPEVWFLTPDNLNRSLYSWRTGPLQRIAKLLSEQFLYSDWKFEFEGKSRKMPETLENAHRFFQKCVPEFPFWKEDLKPRLESALGNYLGRTARFGLQPDILALEEWLQQQLAVSFSADAGGPLIPLPNMGDGWQALVRLAALEVIESYSEEATSTPVLLIYEEPETYLHPHLRRKLRKVFAKLAKKGWLFVGATHATEFISFEEPQKIVRLWRKDTATSRGHLLTEEIPAGPKFQARLDERGNHELVLANRVVLCEGKDDIFALRTYFEKTGTDLDAIGVTLLDVGGCKNEPDFARISEVLGIPWCALTDEDILQDGSINPSTEKVRSKLEKTAGSINILPIWKESLEACLFIEKGKATPEWQAHYLAPKSLEDINCSFPDFIATCEIIQKWIEK